MAAQGTHIYVIIILTKRILLAKQFNKLLVESERNVCYVAAKSEANVELLQSDAQHP